MLLYFASFAATLLVRIRVLGSRRNHHNHHKWPRGLGPQRCPQYTGAPSTHGAKRPPRSSPKQLEQALTRKKGLDLGSSLRELSVEPSARC
ncbi:hypothetical protein NDU88_005792 [Pleurodeles waltl]|uniref:Secreted protein n=1 Tax=Pleurodeles waltl TaxID=8319 RepID=A0AAV7MYK5_PLEWA|nr:hypothetical protein NDU88_005792 [Pleurodeles waltl]